MLATAPCGPGRLRAAYSDERVELAQRDGARETRSVARIERARAERLRVGGAAADGVA